MDQYSLENNITVIIVLYREDYNLLYKTLDKIRKFRKIIIDNSNNIELKNKVEANFKIEKYIDEIDLLLVMTVNPGFGGQKFLESSVSKIREAKKLIGRKKVILQVDGGINHNNVKDVVLAGATNVVAGSSIFTSF